MRWLHARRFLLLLGSLLLLLVIYPPLQGLPGTRLLGDVLLTLVFLVAFQVIFAEREYRLLALLLGGPTLVASWTGYVLPGLPQSPVITGFHLLAVVFLTFTVVVLLRGIFRAALLSADSIYAALCGYLLVGIAFGHLYCVVEVLSPGSFHARPDVLVQIQDDEQRRVLLTYFSLVTLTTLGYGDIVPATNAARALAGVEAVAGQLYLGVFLAQLIGIRVAQILAGLPHDPARGPANEATPDGPADR